MNISFQNQTNSKRAAGIYPGEYAESSRMADAGEKIVRSGNGAVNVDFSDKSFRIPGALDELRESKEKSKTFAEFQQEASFADVGISRDYMTLMSHTMSDEDYRKLSEEGFDISSMTPEETVTIVDKIKAELVRSGQHIAGYTDDLDVATLAEAVGSESLARAVSDSFAKADVPVTKENISEVAKAWTMASELSVPTEGTYQYMVDNGLDGEIGNFYLAQNSGANLNQNSYVMQDYPVDENLQKQIDQVLEQAGYEINETNRESARWLLAHRLPLTEESLHRLEDLKTAVIPVTEEVFVQAVTAAVADGKSPICGNLSANQDHRSLYEKAVEVLNKWTGDDPAIDITDITARKQLEEIRLRMTAEVNLKLIKSGFAIDTAPMEELLAALNRAEQSVAGEYFPNDEQAVSKYQNWYQTNQVMTELPALPVQLLGTVRIDVAGDEGTVLSRFHAEGVALQQTYQKAGESYEALMTAPRADLGDSIRKAFGNVEELVREMGLEPTEANNRIVRILGYSRMEINEENFARVQEADAQVRTLIEKMTPAATLQMIRDGVNPLEESIAQLNAYFDSLPQEFLEEAESYSRYLYGLEQNKQITESEKEAYIGVYRLLHQLEKKDGSAIGAVVNTHAAIEFSNLLSALRSDRFKHMDVRATDELGMLRELVQKGTGLSISDQIMAGYEKEQLSRLRDVAKVESAAVSMLERGEVLVAAENLLVANSLIKREENPFKTLRQKALELGGKEEAWQESLPKAEGLWEQLDNPVEFEESYRETLEELQSQAEELSFAAESHVDVRMMKTAHMQLGIMSRITASQEYFLPMYVGEEPAMVHLTFEAATSEKGRISIAVDMGDDSHVEAHLQVQGSRVDGYLVGKTSFEVTKLKEASDIFSNLINQNASLRLEAVQLPVVSRGNINWTGTSDENSQGEATSLDNGMLYRVAKLFLQAMK